MVDVTFLIIRGCKVLIW